MKYILNHIEKYFIPSNKIAYAAFVSSIGIISGIMLGLLFQTQSSSENIVQIITSYNFLDNIYEIFMNNLRISIITIVLSITFYSGATLLTFVNLYIFSYSATINTIQNGIQNTLTKYPHSILELPAIIISLAISYYISDILMAYLKDKSNYVYNDKGKKITVSFIFVIFLLLLSSIIESSLIYFNFI